MADSKLSALAALTGANVADGDLFYVDDISVTTSKSITAAEARIGLYSVPATQAQQETGTSNVVSVTPGVQHYHPSAAKAWGVFAGSSGTLSASYNITSVVRNALGDYTVTIATDFSSANYAIALGIESSVAGFHYTADKAAGSFNLLCRNVADSTGLDPTSVSFACYGDQ